MDSAGTLLYCQLRRTRRRPLSIVLGYTAQQGIEVGAKMMRWQGLECIPQSSDTLKGGNHVLVKVDKSTSWPKDDGRT